MPLISLRFAILPVAAAVLGGCFLPRPDDPAGAAAAAPPSAAPDFEAPPALPEADQAYLADEAAGIAEARRQVAGGKVEYRLAPKDRVGITVFRAPEMSRKLRVDSSGAVFLAQLGPVKIAGMTLAEAQAAIEDKLAIYLINPRISLAIEEYGNKTFCVMGEVRKPGAYALAADSPMTVPDAIRAAGGFTRAAARSRPRLLRDVDGSSVVFTITQDVVLEPNDVVFVPQNVD